MATLELKRRCQVSERCTGLESGSSWVCLKACQKERESSRHCFASKGSKMEAGPNQTSSSTISSSLSCVMSCRYTESTGDVSGCRSKACPVTGSFSKKKKVKQLFFCREQEGLATCGVSSSLEREEGRTNSYALWCGISTSFRSAKRETAQPPVVRWVCLVHQSFIGKKEWRDCFYRNPLVLADFYLLRTKSYNPLLISSR